MFLYYIFFLYIDHIPRKHQRENASQFLGKTAYYSPSDTTIVLYTEGRHPKDVMRSFVHEMIHHKQNLEGRLGRISTTNTMKAKIRAFA